MRILFCLLFMSTAAQAGGSLVAEPAYTLGSKQVGISLGLQVCQPLGDWFVYKSWSGFPVVPAQPDLLGVQANTIVSSKQSLGIEFEHFTVAPALEVDYSNHFDETISIQFSTVLWR